MNIKEMKQRIEGCVLLIYLRVSSDDSSTDSQLDYIKDMLGVENFEYVYEEPEGVSRDDMVGREQWSKCAAKATELTAQGKKVVIVVFAPDRLWSGYRCCTTILDQAANGKFQLLSLRSSHSNHTPVFFSDKCNEKLAFDSCFTSEEYQNTISDLILDKKTMLVKRGLWSGGIFPCGFNCLEVWRCRMRGLELNGKTPRFELQDNKPIREELIRRYEVVKAAGGRGHKGLYRRIDFENNKEVSVSEVEYRGSLSLEEKKSGCLTFVMPTMIEDRLETVRFIFNTLCTEEIRASELSKRLQARHFLFWGKGWTPAVLENIVRDRAIIGRPTIGKSIGKQRFTYNADGLKDYRAQDCNGKITRTPSDSPHRRSSTEPVYTPIVPEEMFNKANENITKWWTKKGQPPKRWDNLFKNKIYWSSHELESDYTDPEWKMGMRDVKYVGEKLSPGNYVRIKQLQNENGNEKPFYSTAQSILLAALKRYLDMVGNSQSLELAWDAKVVGDEFKKQLHASNCHLTEVWQKLCMETTKYGLENKFYEMVRGKDGEPACAVIEPLSEIVDTADAIIGRLKENPTMFSVGEGVEFDPTTGKHISAGPAHGLARRLRRLTDEEKQAVLKNNEEIRAYNASKKWETTKGCGGPISLREGIWLEYECDPEEFHVFERAEDGTVLRGGVYENVSLQSMVEVYEEIREDRLQSIHKDIDALRAECREEEEVLRRYYRAKVPAEEQEVIVKELKKKLIVKEGELKVNLAADIDSIRGQQAKLRSDCENCQELLAKAEFNRLRMSLDNIFDYILVCSDGLQRDGLKIIKGGEIVFRFTEEEMKKLAHDNRAANIKEIRAACIKKSRAEKPD